MGLLDAFYELKIQEPVERVMLFKTNHGTDAHLTVQKDIENVSSYQSVILSGQVKTRPRVLRGGHVIFQLQDETGSVDCAVYQPTGSLRKVALQLIPGDKVRAMGGVRSGPSANPTLNVEKLEIVELIEELRLTRPRCSACGSSGESMGKGQFLRCRKCGFRYPRGVNISAVSRNLRTGLYLPPPRAHRHLTKPESRYCKSGLPRSNDLGRSRWLSLD
jgi:tRNA(Ile2)-agmatinylcytidine synthase